MSVQQSQNEEWSSQHSAAYAEAGNMLRHYSTTRIAVLSIALPVCLAILGWVFSSSRAGGLSTYLLVAEAIVFLYSLALSLFFSSKYEQTRQALVRMEAGETVYLYNALSRSRLQQWLKLDGIDKSLITAGLILHGVYYVYYLTS